MMVNENISDPMKLWKSGDKGVDVIVKAYRKINDVNDIEVGNAVVWKSGGREYGHVAIISEVSKKDDKVVSYKVIHAEAPWENSKLGIKGGGNVNETEIIVGGNRGYSRSKYNHKFYEWDSPSIAKYYYFIPVFTIIAIIRNVLKLKKAKKEGRYIDF